MDFTKSQKDLIRKIVRQELRKQAANPASVEIPVPTPEQRGEDAPDPDFQDGQFITEVGEVKVYKDKSFTHNTNEVIRLRGGKTSLIRCEIDAQGDCYALLADKASNEIEAMDTDFYGAGVQSTIRCFNLTGSFTNCRAYNPNKHCHRFHDECKDVRIEGGSTNGGGLSIGGQGLDGVHYRNFLINHTVTDFVKIEQGKNVTFDNVDFNSETIRHFSDTADDPDVMRYLCMNIFGDPVWMEKMGYCLAHWRNCRANGVELPDNWNGELWGN